MAERRLAQGRSDPPDPQRPRLGAAVGDEAEEGAAAGSGQTRAVPPAVQAALDRMRSQFSAEVRTICDSTYGQMEQLVATSLSDLSGKVEEHDEKLQDHTVRIQNLERKMEELQTKQDTATQQAAAVAESVTEVRQEMALSAASVPPPPRRTGWDRDIDRGLLVLRAAEPVSMGAVLECIRELLESANVRAEAVQVTTPQDQKLANRWFIRPAGAERDAARKVDLLLSHFRTSDGKWRSFEAEVAEGRICTCWLDADKSPKMVRQEIATKQLLGVFKASAPERAWRAVRAKGHICTGQQIVAKVEVSEDAPPELQWNQRVVPTLTNFPKEEIVAAWGAKQAASGASAAEWGS